MNLRFCLFLAFMWGLFCSSLAGARLLISAGYSGYITPSSWEDQLDHYMNLGANFKHHAHFPAWFYGTEVESFFSLDKSRQNYLAFPDLFLGYKGAFRDFRFQFIVGRHKRVAGHPVAGGPAPLFNSESPPSTQGEANGIVEEPWSAMDEIWNLGLWQGRINWDYLRPKQQGLTGAFFSLERKQLLFSLFVSGLFFPEQGPAVDINKGQVASHSRWFIPPQSEFVLFSQRMDALYWLNRPYLKNILLNESVALRFRFGDRDSQWFSMAYAYKPIHQVYFKVDGRFSIDQQNIQTALYFQPFRHSLLSMDFGLKKPHFQTILSVTQEIPHRPESPGEGISPTLPKALFVSARASVDFSRKPWYQLWQSRWWPLQEVSVDLLYSQFTDLKKKGSAMDQRLDLDININRFRMTRGFVLSAKSRPFNWRGQSFALLLSYWYSVIEGGGWLNGQVQWQVMPKLAVLSEVDILGAQTPDTKSFFNSYRQNDRVSIKVNYVF